ncbi:MAG: SurA N-terminal domain-containing protein [Bacteroidota bacterium]|nr:SurA N-terminal domain-containing protein [Bacteroidota bacterium]
MAVLQKIRTKAGVLIIVFVGVALFLFIVDPSTFEGLFNKRETNIAKINGEKISYIEYQNEVERLTNFVKEAQQKSSLDPETIEEIRSTVWEQLLNKYLLAETIDELGIGVSQDEMENLLWGSNIHPIIQQNFANPQTGQLDTSYVQQFFNQAEQDQRMKIIAEYFKESIKRDRINTKYEILLKKGFYVPTPLAKEDYFNSNTKVNFAYMGKMYKTIPDEDVEVKEADLKSYYDEHKYMFKNEESTREIEYVSFDIIPTSEDSAKLVSELKELKNRFVNTDDNRAFVQMHSDIIVRQQYFAPEEIPGNFGEAIFDKEPGYISDIIKTDTTYMIFKLVSVETIPDSVKARHILIQPDNLTTLEQAHAKIDSIKSEIEKGALFENMAMQFSMGPSGKKGGDLGWFGPGQMVKPFNDACFYGEAGDLPIVESQFGVHLIKIEEQSEATKQAQLAIVNKDIDYSNDTYQKTYAEASRFASNNNTPKAYDEAVVEKHMVKKIASGIKENDKEISGLEYPREIIKWAYDVEKDDISEVFESGDKFVIAKLTNIQNKGTAPLAQVKEDVESIVLKKKKAAMLIENIEQAMKDSDALAVIAGKMEARVDTARNISFNSFSVPRLGIEPKLIGRATNMEPYTLDGPVEGNNGVFVYMVTQKMEAPAIENYSQQQIRLKSQLTNRVGYKLLDALKKASEIEDNRSDFF